MKYQTILVDPPWEYGQWGKANPISRPNSKVYPMPYKTMPIEVISNIPVHTLADDNCELYLWTTQRYLPHVFDILNTWGFKYCQTLIWCKTPRGTGQGGVYCPTNEFLILGRIGRAPKVKRINSTWFLTERPHNSHSTKPQFFIDMIEQVTNPPRIELFARRKRFNWDVWGNEVYKDVELSI